MLREKPINTSYSGHPPHVAIVYLACMHPSTFAEFPHVLTGGLQARPRTTSMVYINPHARGMTYILRHQASSIERNKFGLCTVAWPDGDVMFRVGYWHNLLMKGERIAGLWCSL